MTTQSTTRPRPASRPLLDLSNQQPDILFQIFLFLNGQELETVLKVCKLFHSVATNEKKWLELSLQRWGPHLTFFHPFDPARRRPRTVKGTEYRSFYVRPRTQWRNIYKTREMDEALYKNEAVQVMKIYNQADIKLMSMTSDALSEANKTTQITRPKLNQLQTTKPIDLQVVKHERMNTYDLENDLVMKKLLKGSGSPKVTESDEEDEEFEAIERRARDKVTSDSYVNTANIVVPQELNAGFTPALRRSHSFDTNTGLSSSSAVTKQCIARSPTSASAYNLKRVDDAKNIDTLVDFEPTRGFGNEGVWKNCGFHLINCRLLDGQVVLNCRNNFKHVEQPFRRRYSYDLMLYSLLSSKSVHSSIGKAGQQDPSYLEQWVSQVTNFSSSFGSRTEQSHPSSTSSFLSLSSYTSSDVDQQGTFSRGSVENVIGVSNTYPNYGTHPQATWSPATRIGSREFLELKFDTEVYVNHIEIFETYRPGCVTAISLLNKESKSWDCIYRSDVQKFLSNARARIFSPHLKPTLYKTNSVRIDFDCRHYGSWCEIDAIKLCGSLELNSSSQPTRRKIRQLTEIDAAKMLTNQDQSFNQQRDSFQLSRQNHVTHFPFDSTHPSPADYNFGISAFTVTEDSLQHATDTLVVIGASSMFKDQLFLKAQYIRDLIVAIKLLRNMSCMVIVKQLRIPTCYQIHVWDLPTKRLIKTYETRALSELLNDLSGVPLQPNADSATGDQDAASATNASQPSANSYSIGGKPTDTCLWELTETVVACGIGSRVLVFDVSGTQTLYWSHLYTFAHASTVMSISLNDEMRDVVSIVATGSVDRTCKIWSLHSGKCLSTMVHSSPVASVKLIACGLFVATCTVDDAVIRIWDTSSHKEETVITNCIRKINVYKNSSPSRHLGDKSLCFDGRYFTLFCKGSNEYCLARFHSKKNKNHGRLAYNRYLLMDEVDSSKNGSCTIL